MRSFYFLVVLAIALSQSKAQSAPSAFVRPGAIVRVTNTKADTVFGYMIGQSPDSLWLSGHRFNLAEIASISTLERDRGKGARKGLKWGAGIGAALIIGGVISDARAGPCQDLLCVSATAAGSFFAVISTTLGAILGATTAQPEWRSVK